MQKPESEFNEDGHLRMGAKASLEKAFFQSYLISKGLTEESLKSLPEKEAVKIRKEAALYASTKMAEEESRARFVQDIHGRKAGK
jgi:hypothetical protein